MIQAVAQIRSLGLRSDLGLIDGEFVARDDYLVVRSPRQPDFYWGNLLVFSGPPQAGCLKEWESAFDAEFSGLPEVLHRTFTWDLSDRKAYVDDFVAKGYRYERTVVLVAREVRPPPHPNSNIRIRPLRSDEDWREAVDLQVESRDPEFEEAVYRTFVAKRLAVLRERTRRGHGEWYGAYLRGSMVGSLGIFRNGAIARFQEVATHPSARRQGVCGTLVHEVSRRTLARRSIESLVMLADTEYHAARIYESVGFMATERLEGLYTRPEETV